MLSAAAAAAAITTTTTTTTTTNNNNNNFIIIIYINTEKTVLWEHKACMLPSSLALKVKGQRSRSGYSLSFDLNNQLKTVLCKIVSIMYLTVVFTL